MISVTWRGTSYNVPEPGDTFPQSLTDYLNAVSTGAVPFPTTADIDLGAAFGVKALDFKTRAANPSASGLVRLANGDTVAWRNVGNTADLALAVDAQNQLTFAGNELSGNPFLGANTAAGQSIPNAAATIVVFGTVEIDTDSGYSAGTGRYTIPVGKGGHYLITSAIMWATAPGTGGTLAIFKNAATIKEIAPEASAASTTYDIQAILNLAAGDVIDIRAVQVSGGPVVLSATAARNYVAIKRITT